jgi:hypothetical protein
MSGPRYSREAFAPPDPTAGEEPGTNGAPGTNGGQPSAENVDETRPRSPFGVPGTGPAGGFEGRPFAPPAPAPLAESMPSPDHNDGFSEPTLASGTAGPADGRPVEPFGATTAYAGPGPHDAPTGYAEAPTGYPDAHPGYADAPTGYAEPGGYAEPPPGAFGDRPGLGDRPPNFDHPGLSGPGGYGEATVGLAGVGGPPGGMAPGQPMGPPSGAGTTTTGARSRPSQQRARGPRRAKLQLRHINPWTVLKFSCVLSVALFFVWLITIGLLYGILQAAGVIGNINDAVTTINGDGSKNAITPGLVFGGSAIIGVINVVLFIALSTVGSVVYNLCADLVGGIEVTLSERE